MATITSELLKLEPVNKKAIAASYTFFMLLLLVTLIPYINSAFINSAIIKY